MALRRRLLWLIAFALVAAQTLGLVHRITHGGAAGAANFASHGQLQLVSPGGHWTDALKAGHTDDVTCHVFDQASSGGWLFATPSSLPAVVFPEVLIARQHGQAQARRAALFEARGPPSFS